MNDDMEDLLAAEVNKIFDAPAGQARFRVFPTIRSETVKKHPGLAWQVVDMTATRCVANCYQENDANHIAYLLNLDA